jgi:NADH:ubiquinone reductase (H+-translocating)
MGRVQVEPDLSVAGCPGVFVIGDLASFTHQTGEPLPGTAPVAMQQARAAARGIRRLLRGESPEPFRYRDKGSMATIGRAAAVAQIAGLKLTGLIAWLAWLFIHIAFLIGFRSRVAVLLEWAWSYITWQRGARLITGDVRPDLVPSPVEPVEAEVADEREATVAMPSDRGGGGWMEGDPHQARSDR